MQKRLESAGFFLKPAKFAAAFVTIDDHPHPLGQKPVNQGKNGQAQAVRKRNQDDAGEHDQAARELIKIPGGIKLAALANRAIIKDIPERGDLAPWRRTMRTIQRHLFLKLKGGILLALRAVAGY